MNNLKFRKATIYFIIVLAVCFSNNLTAQEDQPVLCDWLCPEIIEGQTIPVDPLTRTYTVQDATQLHEILSCLYQDWQVYGFPGNPNLNTCFPIIPSPCSGIIPSCDNPITILIEPGYEIDFGDITTLDIFPIEVPPGVTIQGDFDLSNVSDGISYGTRIKFPYLFGGGLEPTVPLINFDSPSTSCNMDNGFVFKLNDGAAIKNVCLVGPQTTAGDYRADAEYRNVCSTPVLCDIREGTAGGILVNGNKCTVSDCEIYGFSHAGIMLREMVITDENGNVTTPSPCFEPEDPGQFFCYRNYFHHCKYFGWGYGVNIGYVGTKYLPTQPTPPPIPSNYKIFNFYGPDEMSYVYDNIFNDNKHDLDCTPGRLSISAYNNAFGERGINTSVNYHWNNGCYFYNPNGDVYTCSGNDYLYQKVGGQSFDFHDNVFLRIGFNMEVTHPNLTPPPSGNNVDPILSIVNNCYHVPQQIIDAIGTNELYWQDNTTCNDIDGHDKILIDTRNIYKYYFDATLQTPSAPDALDPYIEVRDNQCGSPEYLVEAGCGMPVASITSATADMINNNIYPDGTPKVISEGESVYFLSETGLDNELYPVEFSTHTLVNLWDFNDATAGQWRTPNTGDLLEHRFDDIGISNVNLTTLDLTPGEPKPYTSSSLTTQQITVKPADLNKTYLSFWVLDTYKGRQVQPYTNCNYGVDDIRETASPYVDLNDVGFEKFARIWDNVNSTWIDVYVDDIAGDEGWYHVVVELPITSGILEIGLRTTQEVDAEKIRGVGMYIDDVYINCEVNTPDEGLNCVANGNFETADVYSTDPHNPTSLTPADWTTRNFPAPNTSPFVNTVCQTDPTTIPYNDEPIRLSKDEVRSGHYALKAYVKSIPSNEYRNDGTVGFAYQGSQEYKVISIPYDITIPALQISQQRTALDFTLKPNPANAGTAQQVSIIAGLQKEQNSVAEVISSTGTVIYKKEFKGHFHSYTAPVAPGIYTVKLSSNNSISYKKMIVMK